MDRLTFLLPWPTVTQRHQSLGKGLYIQLLPTAVPYPFQIAYTSQHFQNPFLPRKHFLYSPIIAFQPLMAQLQLISHHFHSPPMIPTMNHLFISNSTKFHHNTLHLILPEIKNIHYPHLRPIHLTRTQNSFQLTPSQPTHKMTLKKRILCTPIIPNLYQRTSTTPSIKWIYPPPYLHGFAQN